MCIWYSLSALSIFFLGDKECICVFHISTILIYLSVCYRHVHSHPQKTVYYETDKWTKRMIVSCGVC